MPHLRHGLALHLMLLVAARSSLASAHAPASVSATSTSSTGVVIESAAATAPPRPEDWVSGSGNMSLVDVAEQVSMFRCGAAICARPSICCMSNDLRNAVTGVPTAICCAPESGCRFLHFNKTSGIRTLNKAGIGEPRCFACAWWRLRLRNPESRFTGCENRCGGSRCCGGNAQCANARGRNLLGGGNGERR